MDRKSENELPPPHAERDEGLTNEAVDRDSKNAPAQRQDAEPEPAERPDLDWAEHED